jgi:hypothetical protein
MYLQTVVVELTGRRSGIQLALGWPSADTTKISTIPPIKPKAGELYVINGEHQNYWTCDGYKWVNKGRYCICKVL